MTDIAVQSSQTAARPLWLRVLIATPIGWAVGIPAGVGMIILAESVGAMELQTPLVVGVALGISMQQYHALRPALAHSRTRWGLASCFGLAIPFMTADLARVMGRPLSYDLALFVMLGGVLASVLQWRMLRASVTRAGGWLVASPAGYAAAASTVWLNDQVLPKTPGIIGALQYLGVILAGGVVFGVVTALAAVRFGNRPTH